MLTPYKIEHLRQKICDIEKHFQLDTYRGEFGEYLPWDELRDSQKLYVRAYVALCHAEIENYFEQWAAHIVNKAFSLWETEKKITLPLFSLFVHFRFIDTKNANTEQKVHQMKDLFKRSVIERNDGIREDNIRELFRPLGMDDGVINSISPVLNSFGNQRGQTVHSSTQTQKPLDIPTLISDVNNILQGIRLFEHSLEALSRSND